MSKAASKRESAEYQREVDQFVRREVIYCVSSLISELAKKEEYQEELFPVIAKDDYESAARDEGWKNGQEDKYGCHYFLAGDGATWAASDDAEGWRDLCEAHDIEPQISEAYEHWIVTGWLADKLEAKGEMILRDFMGIGAVWGRTCTGQAIALDSVICAIWDELGQSTLRNKIACAVTETIIKG